MPGISATWSSSEAFRRAGRAMVGAAALVLAPEAYAGRGVASLA
jgi:hypothetical protein